MIFNKITEKTVVSNAKDFDLKTATNASLNAVVTDMSDQFKDLTLGGDYYFFGFKNIGGDYGMVNILGTVGVDEVGGSGAYFSTVVGYNATIQGGVGGLYNSYVNGATLYGMGAYHRAANGNGIAIGRGAVTDSFGVAIGSASCSITGIRSVAIGSRDSFVVGDYSITIGGNTTVTGNNSVNVGYGSSVTGNNSGAFGAGVVVSGDNLIKVGSSLHTVKIDGTLALGTGNVITAAAAAPSTHKVAVSINGVTYNLLATTA